MTTCEFCPGQVVDVGGEEVCANCGRVQKAFREPLAEPVSKISLAAVGKLGSFIGSPDDTNNATQFYNTGRSLALVKLSEDHQGDNSALFLIENSIQRAAERFGLGHNTTTYAILTARQTHARSRKLGVGTTALAVHALTKAIRDAGRFDVSLAQVKEHFTAAGRRFSNSQFNLLCQEFPLPAADGEAFLTMGLRRLFGQTTDPHLIGSVSTEAKRLLALLPPDGRNPRTNPATVLYLAAKKFGMRLTQKRCAELFGMAEYTVRENIGTVRPLLTAEAQRSL